MGVDNPTGANSYIMGPNEEEYYVLDSHAEISRKLDNALTFRKRVMTRTGSLPLDEELLEQARLIMDNLNTEYKAAQNKLVELEALHKETTDLSINIGYDMITTQKVIDALTPTKKEVAREKTTLDLKF